MKNINTGTSSFEELIGRDFCYVDKTKYFYDLIVKGTYYFCSRPRRFGKSLTISTLKAIFQGKRELFKGLYIDSTDYDWKQYPIIHLDFAACSVDSVETLSDWISEMFSSTANEYSISLDSSKPVGIQFYNLIDKLSAKGKLVILIDEYDRVLSNNLFNENVEDLRKVLRSVYEVIKGKSDKIRFCFMTGVTKYAKLSIFSALNNLEDISFNKAYANMFGYTQKELEENFAEYIEQGCKETGLTREKYLQKMKDMYDGYCFYPGTTTVYNPVSVGFFFKNGGEIFDNYWIETGNMTMLMDIARRVDFSPVAGLKRPLNILTLGSFDLLDVVKKSSTSLLQAMLLQTGYLTIKRETPDGNYVLDFSNREIKQSFTRNLVDAYLGCDSVDLYSPYYIGESFSAGNVEEAIEQIKCVYSAVPYQLADGFKEHGWHVSFLTMLIGMGIEVNAEESVSKGRIDCDFEINNNIYIIELKKDQSAEVALKQIHDMHYADKFLSSKNEKTIHLIGINFSSTLRNIDDWKEEVV